MKCCHILAGLFVLAAISGSIYADAGAEKRPWSARAADAAIARWPNGQIAPAGARSRWNYELGTLLEGFDAVWLNSGDGRYFNYIKDSVDQLVNPDGSIPTWRPE